MLTLGIVLLLTMVAAELYVIHEWPIVGRWLRHNSKLSLVFSLLLSWLLTMLFPAAGMLVLLASIGSTVVMQPIYRIMDRWAKMMRPVRAYIAMVREVIDAVYSTVMFLRRMVMWVRHPVVAWKTRS